MTAHARADQLTWWLLCTTFGLLAATNAGLAITERTTWPYALTALMAAASAWCARQALRPAPSAGASRSKAPRTGTFEPGTSRLSRLGA
ncbi:hypothetical protein SAMN05216553_105278 [Lentzea fradiae]|uniref:Uncharacterized protein n=1 Tax=Lentzea fradiae TaxID=200378 RepID=A0A1G7RFL9_9PSEU|nr:hypothetical protein SAMN05216553_105278 [Lentzea fradiae]